MQMISTTNQCLKVIFRDVDLILKILIRMAMAAPPPDGQMDLTMKFAFRILALVNSVYSRPLFQPIHSTPTVDQERIHLTFVTLILHPSLTPIHPHLWTYFQLAHYLFRPPL